MVFVMTTNASPEYFAAEQRYQEAKTLEQKRDCLIEMLRYAPKHKASEHLLAELTRKIAMLKKDIEKAKEQQKKTSGGASVGVKKDGMGQIVLIGLPNVGKSHLLHSLTGADVEIASYPFTTKNPEIGMLNFLGSKIQLVELPALIEGSSFGKANGIQMLSIARNSDGIVLVLNALNPFSELAILKKELENSSIVLNREKPKIELKNSPFKGITIAGKQFLKVKEADFLEFLKNTGVHNASVILGEDADFQKLSEALNEKLVYKKCMIVLNEFFGKADEKTVLELQKQMPVIQVNELTLFQKEMLEKSFFYLLGKVLVYTKKPGESVEIKEPLVLEKGATVEIAAKVLHKEFAENFKYAKVWGSSKFPGQRVARDYVLQNEDVVEIYC